MELPGIFLPAQVLMFIAHVFYATTRGMFIWQQKAQDYCVQLTEELPGQTLLLQLHLIRIFAILK